MLKISRCLFVGLAMTAGSPMAHLPASSMCSTVMQGRMISWQTDFDKAMALAKAEKKVVFIAINMEGERANEEAVRVHYKDSRILSLSKSTINLFATADRGEKGKRSRVSPTIRPTGSR